MIPRTRRGGFALCVPEAEEEEGVLTSSSHTDTIIQPYQQKYTFTAPVGEVKDALWCHSTDISYFKQLPDSTTVRATVQTVRSSGVLTLHRMRTETISNVQYRFLNCT